jgi:hypothetical protein
MTVNPNQTQTEKIQTVISWTSVLIKVLSAIEQILPAFLVAWNNYLRNQKRSMEGRLELEKIKRELAEKKLTEPHNDSRSILSRFLSERGKKR